MTSTEIPYLLLCLSCISIYFEMYKKMKKGLLVPYYTKFYTFFSSNQTYNHHLTLCCITMGLQIIWEMNFRHKIKAGNGLERQHFPCFNCEIQFSQDPQKTVEGSDIHLHRRKAIFLDELNQECQVFMNQIRAETKYFTWIFFPCYYQIFFEKKKINVRLWYKVLTP